MKGVLQRVLRARVLVDDVVVGEIEQGLLVYVGFAKADSPSLFPKFLEKVLRTRMFENDLGKTDLSVLDKEGSVLFVSQFTLYGSLERGRRPSFDDAMPPEEAEQLYRGFESFASAYASEGKQPRHVAFGKFRSHMRVESVNDGPFTLLLEVAST
ncbi:MAG: D-tyrosyl-tRNA(Tyr) deacylase [Polyangiaceae bacterium]|nr:D-tyrosyl-tRNA(Tyr) deacylase [Polyangiaceae bacterium]